MEGPDVSMPTDEGKEDTQDEDTQDDIDLLMLQERLGLELEQQLEDLEAKGLSSGDLRRLLELEGQRCCSDTGLKVGLQPYMCIVSLLDAAPAVLCMARSSAMNARNCWVPSAARKLNVDQCAPNWTLNSCKSVYSGPILALPLCVLMHVDTAAPSQHSMLTCCGVPCAKHVCRRARKRNKKSKKTRKQSRWRCSTIECAMRCSGLHQMPVASPSGAACNALMFILTH